ncbi:MAG: TonB-dependent receptor [Phenylobacterium sp.]|uniref:TonB-dependent receptor n=1 Tax=Phenylobacterium sp. TaxID=1871053 RepID=UPI002732595C|nr:TonB-dependent receptor [Phenylobacterium sp.]MDP3748370.1 TonB-dependent receptor [Phenylobacterium sp.]
MTKAWMVSVSALALACTTPGWAQAQNTEGSLLDELIVTAQKREESVQDVPIAVSAFSEQTLKAQGIDTGGQLVQSVPNLSFTRRALRTNFQIRGVGAQLISLSGDDGVGIHHNNVPLTANRLADAEFYDVERVEVLRGPQGTLYGRNATGGVVNIITNKPADEFDASITAEFGNYKALKYQAFINVPLGDRLALRAAGFALQRDGYTSNTLNGQDIDSRDIWAGRVTLAFTPTETLRGFLLWDSFSEDDTRGARKQLCVKDVGLTSVLGVPTGAAQAGLTQGCLPASVYDPNAFGTTNQLSTFTGILARQIGLQPVDSFLGKTISRDLREVEVLGRPTYRPRTELYEANIEWDMTPSLTLTSLTSYNENENYSRGDSTGGYSSVVFPIGPRAPDGFLNDPQIGRVDRLVSESGVIGHSEQWTQEVRLQSKFDGPLNFNIGGIYLDYEALNFTYVAANAATAAVKLLVPTAYVDPLKEPDFSGHNYFVSRTEYRLKSKAVFGELYWQATETLRATLGLRYTDDEKWTRGSGSTLFTPGRGPVFTAPQVVEFKETTGRLNVDWSPDLSFTDDTLIYGSYSKGYKGGGFNPPGVVILGLKTEYEPEFVNAYEFGLKNTLWDGRLLLNLTAFHYDYQGYQIGRSVNKSVFNENIDAKIKGLELESVWAPIDGVKLNANIGYLDTSIEKGRVIDSFNRTQGNPAYVYGNSTTGGCIVNAAGLASILQAPGGPATMANRVCSGAASVTAGLVAAGNAPATAAALAAGAYTYGPGVSLYTGGVGEGVLQDLKGNELPNAPKWTVSLGAQYRWELPGAWTATLRGDYYRQSDSFMRYNNASFDGIRAWDNVNASLILANADLDLNIQVFVKNLQDEDTIVGFDIADENLGATRSIFLLDPRLYGIAITKGF